MKTITRRFIDRRMKLFALMHANDFVLDVGCGCGVYKDLFNNRLGCDLYPVKGSVDIVCDAQQLPFRDQTFDDVVCTEVLEHVLNPRLMINEVSRVLKSGGSFFLTMHACINA